MDELFAVPIHEADVPLAGMEINSAVELCGRGVILHSDHSIWGRETPGLIRLVMRGVLVTLPALLPMMITKTNKGLTGSIKSLQATPKAFGAAPASCD